MPENNTPPNPTASQPTSDAAARDRVLRKTLIGVVRTAKMDKTRRVEVPRLQPHPKYGKFIKKRTICIVHDENNQTQVGDTVEIMETRPLSKFKRWRLVRVVSAAPSSVEGDPTVGETSPATAEPTTAASGGQGK